MKFFRKLSLILALLFFGLSSTIVIIDVLGNYHVIINNCNSNLILTILSTAGILSFSCYIILGMNKKMYIATCTILMLLTAALSLFLGFSPEYRYTTIVSEDGKHTMVVEEKTTSTAVYIKAYEEVASPLYFSKHGVSLSKQKFGDSYKYGDFYIVFIENAYKVYVPLHDKYPSVIKYYDILKTSD